MELLPQPQIQYIFNAASTLTVDSGTSVIGDSLTIRGMGTAGWLLTGTFRNGNTIT
jgi:hypothetical protein